MLRKVGKTLLWLSWLYPFLRGFLTGVLIGIANHSSPAVRDVLQTIGNAIHGGKVTSFVILVWFPVYFVATFIAYIVWHLARRHKIGWKQWIALLLIFVFNIGNTLFLTAEFTKAPPQEKQAPSLIPLS